MQIDETPIPGMIVVTPKRFGDHRGFFETTWIKRDLAAAGLPEDFVQDNRSLSAEVGTLRGLHFQVPPDGQGKLVRCGRGAVFDVGVDLRVGSPTYGRWYGEELTEENGKMLWVPRGFAHGFVTRAPSSEICYKCDGYYAPSAEGALRFDDPDLAIDWGVDSDAAVLSAKDAAAGSFADFQSPFDYEGT